MTSELTPAPNPDAASRLGTFRHDLRTIGSQPARADLERLAERARGLGVREEEIREELHEIRVSLEAIDFADRIAREGLPLIMSLDRLPPGERCHFATPVRFGRRRGDQFGHLELTSGWLKFHGALDVSVVWTEVAAVDRCSRDIIVSLIDSRRVLRFCCHALEEAAHGAVVARYLASGTGSPALNSHAGYHPAL